MSMANLVVSLAAAPAAMIAAVAIPNLLTATQKGKQKATMGDMKTVGMAIESYITDHYEVPPGKTLAEIKNKLEPFYIKRLPLKDGWGNDFHYYHGTGDKKDEYAIGSGGKDGVFNGWDQTGFYIVTTIAGFENDFIFSNGMFTYSPKVR
jgi:general secretion pathway protein G